MHFSLRTIAIINAINVNTKFWFYTYGYMTNGYVIKNYWLLYLS